MCARVGTVKAQQLCVLPCTQDVTGRWVFALDVSGQYKSRFLHYLRTVCGLDVEMSDLRGIMSTLSRDACAIAGHAAALSQWHQVSHEDTQTHRHTYTHIHTQRTSRETHAMPVRSNRRQAHVCCGYTRRPDGTACCTGSWRARTRAHVCSAASGLY